METPVQLDALHTALIDSVTAPDIVALLLHYHKVLVLAHCTLFV